MTEAGDGEDGRIKSALGIGALLVDGLGDTIRVSLSEAPEAEIPVARKLVDYVLLRQDHPISRVWRHRNLIICLPRAVKTRLSGISEANIVPVVIADRMDGKTEVNPQFTPDYIYAGRDVARTAGRRSGIYP